MKYEMNCQKCTNTYTGWHNGKPATWCKPTVDGKKCLDITGTSNKDFVCRCKYYTTEPRQAKLRIV